jgi:hypothetical protein
MTVFSPPDRTVAPAPADLFSPHTRGPGFTRSSRFRPTSHQNEQENARPVRFQYAVAHTI